MYILKLVHLEIQTFLVAKAKTSRKSETTRATRTAIVPLTMTMAKATPYAARPWACDLVKRQSYQVKTVLEQ